MEPTSQYYNFELQNLLLLLLMDGVKDKNATFIRPVYPNSLHVINYLKSTNKMHVIRIQYTMNWISFEVGHVYKQIHCKDVIECFNIRSHNLWHLINEQDSLTDLINLIVPNTF